MASFTEYTHQVVSPVAFHKIFECDGSCNADCYNHFDSIDEMQAKQGVILADLEAFDKSFRFNDQQATINIEVDIIPVYLRTWSAHIWIGA